MNSGLSSKLTPSCKWTIGDTANWNEQKSNLGFWGEGKPGVPWEKPLRAEERTKNHSHMTSSLAIEPCTSVKQCHSFHFLFLKSVKWLRLVRNFRERRASEQDTRVGVSEDTRCEGSSENFISSLSSESRATRNFALSCVSRGNYGPLAFCCTCDFFTFNAFVFELWKYIKKESVKYWL